MPARPDHPLPPPFSNSPAPLLDFETLAAQHPGFRSPDDDNDNDNDIDVPITHRSPPFIQASLPPIADDGRYERQLHSPQPLPIRPRIAFDSSDALLGHTRAPILAREQSTLQSFGRTIRGYVPSAIHIPVPLPAPSPPLLSRPVSFGSFGASRDASHLEHPAHPSPRSRPAGLAQALQHPRSPRGMSYPGSEASLAEPIQWARWDTITDRRFLILAYPSGFQLWDCTSLSSVTEVLNLNTSSSEWQGGGQIVHAAFLPSPVVRHFGDPYSAYRPLLGVMDSSTLFIYSLSRQTIIHQVELNGRAVTFESNPHFIVISLINPATLQIYSPTTFKEIHVISSGSLVSFAHSPVSYSTLTSKLFTTGNNNKNNEHVFLGQQQQHHFDKTEDLQQQPQGSPRPVFALSHRLLAYASPPSIASAHAHGHRSPSRGSGPSSHTSPSTSPFGSLGGLNMHMTHMTQSDLGNAAIKVGGSLLSGVKTLGGMAYTAAKNHIMPSPFPSSGSGNYYYDSNTEHRRTSHHHHAQQHQQQQHTQQHPHHGPHHHHRKYVSISAPSGANNLSPSDARSSRERRYSSTSMTSQDSKDSSGRSWSYSSSDQPQHASPVLPNAPIPGHGSHVTIVDLSPLLAGGAEREGAKAAPITVAEWLTSSQPVAGLKFSPDGCSLVVVPMNGQVVHVWRVTPSPSWVRHVSNGGGVGGVVGVGEAGASGGAVGRESRGGEAMMARMYHLRRGRSQAVIDDVAWAHDGRWVAIGSQRPTVHVFAVNPYGGKPDLKSHTKGKVINVNELQPSSVEIGPLVRLRAARNGTALRTPPSSLAFTFIESSESCLPSSLLPPPTASTSSPPSGETSPHHRARPTNFQDLLVFDPNDGVLYLRRITTEVRAKDQGGGGLSVAASVSMSALGVGATSVSLPGLGGAGKLSSLSSSPSSVAYSVSAASSHASSNRQANNLDLNATHELVGRESVVATWNLQRTRDWEEIRQPITLATRLAERRTAAANKSNYLAYAELSTFSRSPRILPRSVYLSHQFSFYTLGEDYHALVQRSQLDISGQKLEVRKNVEISPFPSGHHHHHHHGSESLESFIEGLGSLRFAAQGDHHHHTHTHRFSGSFDEPLASALAGGLEYDIGAGGGGAGSAAPPVLPMYPNGAIPGSSSFSRPTTRTLRNSIPIRTIGGGVSEGLSVLRREINKVRSPSLVPRRDGGGGVGGDGNKATEDSPGLVPLEFDEEDEDFLGKDGDREVMAVKEEVVVKEEGGPVPDFDAAGGHALIVDDGTDVVFSGGWDSQDRQAVEDEERFHDLIAPGFDSETFGEGTVVQEHYNRRGGGQAEASIVGVSGGVKKKKGKSRRR